MLEILISLLFIAIIVTFCLTVLKWFATVLINGPEPELLESDRQVLKDEN